MLKILELPEGVAAALWDHSANARVRAYFTDKRLRQIVVKGRREAAILGKIERIIGDGS